MVNFYRHAIAHAARHQAPLNVFLRNSKKNDNSPISWNTEAERAFQQCKQDLRDITMVAFPDPDAEIAVMCDASVKSVGAVVNQKVKRKWRPIAFFSKSLSEAQQKYSTYDRELLGIYMAVKHFRRLIEGRIFTIYTDHKPLVHAFDKKPSTDDTPRRIRHLDYISQFSTDIRHVSGEDNVVADALSRVIETISLPTVINLSDLEKYQEGDAELQKLKQNRSLRMVCIKMPNSDNKIYCDVATGVTRPYIPPQMRRIIFDSYHNLSHPGKNTTRRLITKNYIWANMNTEINKWCDGCLQCQRSKIHRHTVSPLGKFMPAARFSHLHFDIVGPLPVSQNKRYLVTMIDRCTSWPEAVPVSDITAETVARVLYEGWIVRHGVPDYLTHDQGSQMESEVFKSLARLMGIEKLRTTPYHPQSNSKVERLHRTIKTALTARANTANWTQELPSVLFGLRSSYRQDTGCSAAELVYGTTIKLPGDFFHESSSTTYAEFVQGIKENIRRVTAIPQRESSDRNVFVHPRLADCTHVFLRIDRRRPCLTPPYEGPFKVIRRTDKVFKIERDNKEVNVSIDRLKPAFLLNAEFNEHENGNRRSVCLGNEDDDRRSISPAKEQLAVKPKITRYGRMSRPTVRFASA